MKVTDTLTPGLKSFRKNTFTRLVNFMNGATRKVQSEARKSLTWRYRGNPNTGGRATGQLADSIYVETQETRYTRIRGQIITGDAKGVYVEFGPKDDSKLRHFVAVRRKGSNRKRGTLPLAHKSRLHHSDEEVRRRAAGKLGPAGSFRTRSAFHGGRSPEINPQNQGELHQGRSGIVRQSGSTSMSVHLIGNLQCPGSGGRSGCSQPARSPGR